MYLYLPKDPRNENKRALVVFVICVLFIAIAFKCSGQQLVRIKTGNFWQATAVKTFTSESDTIIFGSVFSPTPYNFHALSVITTGQDKIVRHLIMEITYKDNMIDYFSSYTNLDFNGASWFNITPYELNRLRTKDIKHIKLINSYNRHSFEVNGFDPIQYYKIALNN